MTWLRIITVLLFVIIFLLWAGQNLDNRVAINNFKGVPVANSPLWMVVLISLAIGIFFMGILGIVQEFRDKNEIKKLQQKISKQHEELVSLRNLPIADELDAMDKKEQQTNNRNAGDETKGKGKQKK
jgi:putative membrane protein